MESPAGLCTTCAHARMVVSDRGSTFVRCLLSESDPRFPKYPRLPVTSCAGYWSMPGEITVHLRQISATTAEAAIGAHRVPIDRPPEKGGSGQGPMGGELFLASVGGCFMSNLLAAVRARKLPIAGLRIEVAGGLADSPPRFESLELRIAADNADPDAMRHAVEIADRGCIMMNTLRGKLDVRLVLL